MSTTGRSATGVIPTRSVQERDRACRALLEEAGRLANAFHGGWLKTNGGFDRERERGEPPVPLKAFQYAARIARAGLENDAALAFLGPVRPAVVASLAALERFPWRDFLLEEYDVEPLQQRLRVFLGAEPWGSAPRRDLLLGRLCEVLMLESSSASRNDDLDAAVAGLREALGRLPETGHEELRFAATLRLGVSEFNRGDTEAAWACAEALPELEVCFPTWYLEAQRRWLVGRLHHRALEEGETQVGSEEASEEAMRKHLEKAAELCELHGGRKGVSMALRELDVLARFYRERERADEYLEMLCRIGEYRNKTFYGSYFGPFCRYEVI